MMWIFSQSVTRSILAAVALAMIAGCQSTEPSARHNAGKAAAGSSEQLPADGDHQHFTAEQAVGGDPCAVRLGNLVGAIFSYMAVNKRLPERLDEVAAYGDADVPIILSCPASGLPYVYNPNGLAAPGKTKRIIVYDASAAHSGNRWAIFMAPSLPGQAHSLEVLEVPEGVFRLYAPVGP
jgi:hypothetical protein